MSRALANTTKAFTTQKKTRMTFEIASTIALYIALTLGASYTFHHSPWLAVLFIIPLALCAVKCFIIQHDCSHGSLFKNKKINTYFGRAMSMLTFTPYHFWRWNHLSHHRSSSNLDERGIGDIHMLTVKEYAKLSKTNKFIYRLSRNPFIFLGLLAPLYFMVIMRFILPYHKTAARYDNNVRNSVYLTDVFLILFYVTFGLLLGFKFLLCIYLPTFILSSIIGTWMFYVQHTFPDSYFVEKKDWDYQSAAFKGSSYYKLPFVLEWATGYIGYHHIHHYSARVPFYRLKEAFHHVPEFQNPVTLTLKDTLMLMKLVVYDTDRMGFITWKEYKHMAKNSVFDNTAETSFENNVA